MSTRRPARGFTLIELLISFVVLSLALTIAAGQLVEAQRQMARATRDAARPSTGLGLEQLRGDLQASAGPASHGLLGLWNREPLVLAGHPAGPVVYRKEALELIRAGGEEDEASERVVLTGVRLFRWRSLAGSRLVEVEIWTYAPGVVGGKPVEERFALSLAPRAAGGRSW